jgi:hypothetical protein
MTRVRTYCFQRVRLRIAQTLKMHRESHANLSSSLSSVALVVRTFDSIDREGETSWWKARGGFIPECKTLEGVVFVIINN